MVVLVNTGCFLVDLSSYILELVIKLLISADDSESLDESCEEITAMSSICARLIVVLIDIGDVLVGTSAYILDLVTIFIISSEDSESLDEHFEKLTVVFSFCACLIVVLINNGVLLNSSEHILDLVILLISCEDSESLDEDVETLALFLLKDLVKSLTLFLEDEDFEEELFCISLGS